jgi:Ca2+/Na+ antiporter
MIVLLVRKINALNNNIYVLLFFLLYFFYIYMNTIYQYKNNDKYVRKIEEDIYNDINPTYNDGYHYSSDYYPGFKLNEYQENKFISAYPFYNYNRDNELDLQIYYNISDNDITPTGSIYKYTIPRPTHQSKESGFNSISERQKRFKREFFSPSLIDKRTKLKINMYPYLILTIISIIMMLFFATIYDINKPYLCLYK